MQIRQWRHSLTKHVISWCISYREIKCAISGYEVSVTWASPSGRCSGRPLQFQCNPTLHTLRRRAKRRREKSRPNSETLLWLRLRKTMAGDHQQPGGRRQTLPLHCSCTAAALEDDAAKSIPTGWYGSTVSIYSEWRSNSSNSGVEVESHRNRRIESGRGRWLDDGGEDSLMVSSALTSTNMTRTVQFLLLRLFQCPFMWDQ